MKNLLNHVLDQKDHDNMMSSIKSKKAAFKYADGCTERASVLLSAQDKLTPSNGRQLNHVIKEHTEAVNKLSQAIEVLQNHDSSRCFNQMGDC